MTEGSTAMPESSVQCDQSGPGESCREAALRTGAWKPSTRSPEPPAKGSAKAMRVTWEVEGRREGGRGSEEKGNEGEQEGWAGCKLPTRQKGILPWEGAVPLTCTRGSAPT